MVSAAELRRRIDALIARHEPIIRAAFEASVRDITSNVQLGRIVAQLEAGNIDGAIRAVGLDPAAFQPLSDAVELAFKSGGATTANAIGRLTDRAGNAVVIRFDVRNQAAEAWLRDHSSTLVTRIVEDQRVAIRNALTAGMEAGQNPRSMALDIVGRVNRLTGRREGGIVGLTSQQEAFVRSARAELLSGDPKALQHYLTRKLRDRRFDREVLRSIGSGVPIDADTVARATGRYADRLLKLRGDTIARTEALTSLHASKHEAFRQGLDASGFGEDAVTRKWRSSGKKNRRETHRQMHGQTVTGLDTPFQSPSGALLLHPGDTSLGAGADEIVNCECDEVIQFDFSVGLE
jgi:hypothetical protein